MRPGRSYFRVLPGVGREKRRKKNTAFATDANVAADLLKNQTEEDGGLGPRLNRDAARVAWREIRAAVPVTFEADYKPWTEKDDARLRRGVHHYTQQARVFSRERLTLAEVAGVGAASLEALLDDAGGLASVDADADAIDWAEVCAVHLPRRDPADAKARWRNCRDPRLEQRAFDEAEDDRLARIAKGSRARQARHRARVQRRYAPRKRKRERTRTHTRRDVFDHDERRVIDSSIDSSSKKATQRDAVRGAVPGVPEPGPGALELDRGGGRHPAAARRRARRGALGGSRARSRGTRTSRRCTAGPRCLREEERPWRPEETRRCDSPSPRTPPSPGGGGETRPAPAAPRTVENGKRFFKTPRDVKVFLPWSRSPRASRRTDVQCRGAGRTCDPARAAGKARAWTAAEDAAGGGGARRLTTTQARGQARRLSDDGGVGAGGAGHGGRGPDGQAVPQ